MRALHDGRYAPSPTGDLHLGNLRTALVAWLCARTAAGRFVLRIDDLDPDRSRPEHERRQVAALRALGLDWDGDPVRQSDRRDRYDAALSQLAAGDLTYPCFCTRAEVRAAASAPHGASAEGAYPGTCAHLHPTAARQRAEAGEPHCTRVRADGAELGFDDGLLGRTSGVVDDFVVRRRDGVAAYNLATVVDDSDLAITEVVRGADLAETTPRQLWLVDALGLGPAPTFVHVPLVLGPDGARLSKRHGALGMEELARRGVDAPAVRSILGRSLGLLGADEHTASIDLLLERFELATIPIGDVQLPAGIASHDDASRQL